jgi:hypothetical protein
MDEKDYSTGKIYMIWSPHTDKVYIGSTIQPLHERFCIHRTCRPHTSKIILDCGNAEIKLIHDFPCGSKFELETEEGREMRLHPLRVNKYLPGRTVEEKVELRGIINDTARNLPREEKDKRNEIENERRRNWTREQKDKRNETEAAWRKQKAEKKKAEKKKANGD